MAERTWFERRLEGGGGWDGVERRRVRWGWKEGDLWGGVR